METYDDTFPVQGKEVMVKLSPWSIMHPNERHMREWRYRSMH